MSSSQIVVKQENDVDDDYVCGAITTKLDLKDEPQNSGTNRAGTSTTRSTKTITTTTSITDFEVKSEPLEIFDDETTTVNNFGESFLIYELEEKPRKPPVKATTTIRTKPTIINSKLYKKRALIKAIKNTQTLSLSAKKARLENDVATTIATRTEPRATTTPATATTTIVKLTTTPAAAATTLTTATTTTAPATTTTTTKSTTPTAAATALTTTATTKSLPPCSNKKPATLELKVKCLCRLGNPVAASATNVLDLKNFFDEMFNATRQLGRGQQREVKMALLKAISEAEEHVDAGRWCDKCCS